VVGTASSDVIGNLIWMSCWPNRVYFRSPYGSWSCSDFRCNRVPREKYYATEYFDRRYSETL